MKQITAIPGDASACSSPASSMPPSRDCRILSCVMSPWNSVAMRFITSSFVHNNAKNTVSTEQRKQHNTKQKLKGKGSAILLVKHMGMQIIPLLGSEPAGDTRGRLSLQSIRPAVTLPAAWHHHPQDSTKLYWLVTEADRCESLAWDYSAMVGVAPTASQLQVQCSTNCTTMTSK